MAFLEFLRSHTFQLRPELTAEFAAEHGMCGGIWRKFCKSETWNVVQLAPHHRH